MADKNPFVKCKSRKKRKKRIYIKPEVKLYCPSAMVRYDGGKNGFPTMWACKMCLACCLSDITAAQHSMDCRKHIRETRNKIVKKEELLSYTCHVCNRIFSRQVTLKKHLEMHEKIPSDAEAVESDSDKIIIKKSRRGRKKSKAVVNQDIALSSEQVNNEFDSSCASVPSTSKAIY